jgi:hypothetical protein
VREAEHSRLAGAEIKNAWSLASISPCGFVTLKKHIVLIFAFDLDWQFSCEELSCLHPMKRHETDKTITCFVSFSCLSASHSVFVVGRGRVAAVASCFQTV